MTVLGGGGSFNSTCQDIKCVLPFILNLFGIILDDQHSFHLLLILQFCMFKAFTWLKIVI